MDRRLTAKPIAIAADHRGFALKEHLKTWLRDHGYAVLDCGTDSAAERVQMMALAPNRFPFMRSTLVHTVDGAALARQHGDANMLAIGADTVDAATAEEMLGAFLTTDALGDRYAARRERLARLDISKL